MSNARYALIRSNENGDPLLLLTFEKLGELLAHPENWGVTRFGDLEGLGSDPNYWPAGVAVLIRYEEVTPEHAGYRLPAADPQRGDWRHARADGSPITLGEVFDE